MIKVNSVAAVVENTDSLNKDFLNLNRDDSVTTFSVSGNSNVGQIDSPKSILFLYAGPVWMLHNQCRLAVHVTVDDIRCRSRSFNPDIAALQFSWLSNFEVTGRQTNDSTFFRNRIKGSLNGTKLTGIDQRPRPWKLICLNRNL